MGFQATVFFHQLTKLIKFRLILRSNGCQVHHLLMIKDSGVRQKEGFKEVDRAAEGKGESKASKVGEDRVDRVGSRGTVEWVKEVRDLLRMDKDHKMEKKDPEMK